MKNILILVLMAVLAFSCHTTKQASKVTADTSKVTEVSKEVKENNVSKEDKDLQVDVETTGTKTEYYPPAGGNGDTCAVKNHATLAVKSVTTWTTKAKTKDKGKIEDKENNESQVVEKVKEESLIKTTETIKPAPDPKRFMWIFLILALGTGIVIYLKRTAVWGWLKSVLSPAGKNLKI